MKKSSFRQNCSGCLQCLPPSRWNAPARWLFGEFYFSLGLGNKNIEAWIWQGGTVHCKMVFVGIFFVRIGEPWIEERWEIKARGNLGRKEWSIRQGDLWSRKLQLDWTTRILKFSRLKSSIGPGEKKIETILQCSHPPTPLVPFFAITLCWLERLSGVKMGSKRAIFWF